MHDHVTDARNLLAVNNGCTMLHAVLTANVLMSNLSIKDVYVFGSVARKGRGKDLDLILTASEAAYQAFMERMRLVCSIRENGVVDAKRDDTIVDPYYLPEARYFATFRAFARDDRGIPLRRRSSLYHSSLYCLQHAMGLGPHANCLDLFVFPRDWKDRLEELQNALPHRDPNFMENIAKDAICLT